MSQSAATTATRIVWAASALITTIFMIAPEPASALNLIKMKSSRRDIDSVSRLGAYLSKRLAANMTTFTDVNMLLQGKA